MSSARGAAGAVKPKLLNVNTVYAGKNHNAVKAPGAGKHGGLQSLGKTTAVVRRMPPPATLPSLRAESQGQDPNIALVPQGGSGWHTENAGVHGPAADSSLQGAGGTGQGGGISGNAAAGSHANDLRPTWAKQSASADAQHPAALHQTSAANALSRDFPSLAAATAGKLQSTSSSDSLKPQKSGSWRGGGSSALSKNEGADSAPAPVPHPTGHTYPTVSSAQRSIERQLPSRYYDGSAAPPPPPSGAFQVPRHIPATPLSPTVPQPSEKPESRSQIQDVQGNGAVPSVVPQPLVNVSVASTFPANVAVPPPNYSLPPPNFHSLQSDQTGTSRAAYGPQSGGVILEKDVSRKDDDPSVLELSKGGRGDGGYSDRSPLPILEASVFPPAPQQNAAPIRSNDVRASGFIRSDSFDNRNLGFDESSLRMAENDWQGAQFGFVDREIETRRWRVSTTSQDSQRSIGPIDGSQSNYLRGRDDEMGRRENVEREAAIERSRQKRRIASQGSTSQESDSVHVPAGSSRNVGYANEPISEWDRPQSHESGASHREKGVSLCAHHWDLREDGDHEQGRKLSGRREEVDVSVKPPEFRVLRRPESRDSAELPLQMSQIAVRDDPSLDEDDGVQLMKMNRLGGKSSKRVSPRSLSPHNDSSSSVVQCPLPNLSLSSPSAHPQRNSLHQNRNTEKRTPVQPTKRFEGSSDEMPRQNSNPSLRGGGTVVRGARGPDSVTETPIGASLVVAPPPQNNVWEKRAEERESAERERAAQRDALHQIRLHQHFPPVGEHIAGGGGYLDELKECGEEGMPPSAVKDSARNVASPGKPRPSRYRGNQTWNEGNFNNGGSGRGSEGNDYYGQEEEESGGLFRGQREFVNSRVSAQQRSMRGMSLGMRGGRGSGWRSGTYGGIRRGTSAPQHGLSSHSQRHYSDRVDSRRRNRLNGHPLEEEDNFANMGEFHVEDTYDTVGNSEVGEEAQSEGKPTSVNDANGERREQQGNRPQRPFRQQGGSQQHRPTLPLYQTRPAAEENAQGNGRGRRMRGNGSRRGSDLRSTTGIANPAERGKRKKEMSEREEVGNFDAAVGRGVSEEEVGAVRQQGPRRGALRGSQLQPRRRRNSQTQRFGGSQPLGNVGDRSSSQVKSPVTSEGHDEWETASESSDVGDRHGVHYRVIASTKFSGNRRMQRQNNGHRRDNNAGGVSARPSNSSKNGKPASTTSHAAARGSQPLNEETGQPVSSSTATLGSEQSNKREGNACNRDGLAGLDINDAGVIVIDDRPDTEHGAIDDGAESGDFEEVLSKKNRRLRQQQINEKLEAEERRKHREKEKQDRRKAKQQSKKVEKKGGVGSTADERAVQNGDSSASAKLKGACAAPSASVQNNSEPRNSVSSAPQNVLNTTVWNSSIINDQTVRRASPPLQNHPVIPSPIARPTPKTSNASANAGSTGGLKKGVELWTGPDEEQRLSTSKKSPKVSPNATSADGTQSEAANSFKNVAVDANDDERLKERLDKVKDFWPGGQQFSSTLLSSNAASGPIPNLDKSPSTGASSLAHGPNVAKVRPQPQASESCPPPPLKECASSATSVTMIPPPSPVACIPPGAYLQSLSQVPPPAALPHYSMIFGEPYNPHSATSPPAQTLFGAAVPVSHAPRSRSRPTSFLDQSQLFIHPPPSGSAASSLTWSNGGAPQLELLTGISATPPLPPSQGANPLQRFQYSTQGRSALSGSSFGASAALLNSGGKLTHMGAHQVPPPMHPPHSFMPPPPPDLISLQGTALGAVGSQRAADVATSSTSATAISRATVGVLSHMPPPHIQQMSFPTQSQSSFTLTAGSFGQAPAMPAFTAPPPPLRYPPVAALGSDVSGVLAAGWTKPVVNPLSVKFANGNGQMASPISRPGGGARQSADRWGNPQGASVQPASNLVFQSQMIGKENTEGAQAEIEHFASSQACANVQHGGATEEGVRASSVSSVSASNTEAVDGTAQQKKVAKV